MHTNRKSPCSSRGDEALTKNPEGVSHISLGLTKSAVIKAAQEACRSLSRCTNFFNFEETDTWLGWENWLTVDTIRRLDHKAVIRFGRYQKSAARSDIFIGGDAPIAVEVKVNYVDNSELETWRRRGSHGLPARVIKDLSKLDRYTKPAVRLMLLAIAFEKKARHAEYQKLVRQQLQNTLGAWTARWADAGTICLLVMYKDAPKPRNCRNGRPSSVAPVL